MTPTPTLSSLFAAVAADQANLTAASVTITNDSNSVKTNQDAVTAAQANLDLAQNGLTGAQSQYAKDTAALLPDATQLQSDVNALVTFLRTPPVAALPAAA